MASMGFTQDSVKKLMNILDSQQGMDEKTYIELSNAAKYLYDKTSNNRTAVQSAPRTPVYVSDDDELLGPSAVGRDINRRTLIVTEREEMPALENVDDLELAIIASANWFAQSRAMEFSELPLRAPTLEVAQGRARPAALTARHNTPAPLRLCNRHKIKALRLLLADFNHDIPDKNGMTDTRYVEILYNRAISFNITDVTIKNAYYHQKNQELNAMTPRTRARNIDFSRVLQRTPGDMRGL